jgi:3'-5' exoribonuclease
MTDGGSRPEPIDAREFCESRYPWPLIDQLADGDDVLACYLLHESRTLQTKANQDYLRLVLGDRTGTIDAVAWDDVERLQDVCTPGTVLGVRGRVSLYQDRPQLRVDSVVRVRVDDVEMARLVPASPRDAGRMERELDALIASVSDRPLRSLLRRCLGPETAPGRAFRAHPAATRNHHAYLHGLLEHTLSVTGMCDRLVEHYASQGVSLDRDLLVTGALLHDIGKIEELSPPPVPSYTTTGRLLGHIVLGIALVGREGAAVEGLAEDRLLLVQHLIASHQGKPEWDSPKVPQFLEALVLHYADDLDAKMNQAGAALAGVDPGSWTAYDRGLGRYLYQPERGGRERPVAAPEVEGEAGGPVIDLFRE